MTHIEQAIRDAVENGGYEDGLRTSYPFLMKLQVKEGLFLDPLFWQALGKARGWKIEWGKCGTCFLTGFGKRSPSCTCAIDSWKVQWHLFIDHLAEGKDAESFFADLPPNHDKK